MIRILLITIILFRSLALMAQQELSTSNKKAIKDYQEALAQLESRRFPEAIRKLEEALSKDPNFVEAHARLGDALNVMRDTEGSLKHFKAASDLQPTSPKLVNAHYNVGNMYLQQGKYEQAKVYLDRAAAANANNKMLQEKINRDVANCNFSIEAVKHPIAFKPVRLSDTINKFYSVYSPSLSADQQELIFTKRDGAKASQDEDIMISRKKDGRWGIPVTISKKIDTEFNEGTCTMSADGKVLVFVSCNRPEGMGACDLYISYRKGDDWTEPVNLGSKVNSAGWDSEPCLSADGKTLYFSSQRKGGLGNEDIWVTTMDDKGNWSEPKNLGKPVNTPGREVTPFIHANGTTLYFSTNFYPGLGGFDIFVSRKKDSLWSAPKNIGYPINTNINDGFIFITPDSRKGYYAVYDKSNIEKHEAYLYEFDVPQELKEEKVTIYAKGTVYDADTKKKLKASLELYDLKTGKVLQRVSSDSLKGDYLVVLTEGGEYGLYANCPGYLFKSIFFDYKDPAGFNPVALDLPMEPVKAGKAVVLNNIFFASNSWTLEDKSITELNKIILFLQSNPKVSVEFGGHTDDVGSDKDNMELSLKRAKAVYDYLVSKGIAAARLKYKGYGESQPVVPNTSDENRQKNRRLEFKVI